MFSAKIAAVSIFLSVLVVAGLRVEAASIQQEDGSVSWGWRKKGNFRYTFDGEVADNSCETVVLIGVGTAQSTNNYDYLAEKTSAGTSIVTVIFDPNPGNIVKLNPSRYANFYNAFEASLGDLVPVCRDKSPILLAGGHSASAQGGLRAMAAGLFQPDGWIGLSPFKVTATTAATTKRTRSLDERLRTKQSKSPATSIDPNLPTLTWGFTKTTCGVDPTFASSAEYELSGSDNRVLFRADNNNSNSNSDEDSSSGVGHCSFTDSGCGPIPGLSLPGCPAPKSPFLKDLVARSIKVFASSLQEAKAEGGKATKLDPFPFREFDTSNPEANVDVFVNGDELPETPTETAIDAEWIYGKSLSRTASNTFALA